LTKPGVGSEIRWSDAREARFAVLIDPAARQHLVIVVHPPTADRVQVTARFFASHLDPDTVRRALDNALSTPWEIHSTSATEDGRQ
jgi:hypothetical protein